MERLETIKQRVASRVLLVVVLLLLIWLPLSAVSQSEMLDVAAGFCAWAIFHQQSRQGALRSESRAASAANFYQPDHFC